MILCLGPTPAEQRVMMFRKLNLNEVNRAKTTIDGAAGKSINVAKVLKALGESPLAVGFIGGARGERLRKALQERGIECQFVEVQEPTRQCIILLDEFNRTQTELVEESRPVPASDYQRLEAIVRERIKSLRAVIMSGTLTPGGPADFYMRMAQIANSSGALSIVDAQGSVLAEALRAQPGVVKPNREELAVSLGRELSNENQIISAMRDLCERGAARVVVTSGEEPVLAFDGRSIWRILPPRITALNPIGSGDAFTAALAWRLLRGDDLGQASRWGAAAGAGNALTTLAGEVKVADVERLARAVAIEKIS